MKQTISRIKRQLSVAMVASAIVLATASAWCAEEATDKSSTQPVATASEPTVVTSERLQIDYMHNMGTFTGNVLAVDPRITVRADQMIVVFGVDPATTNRTLQKVIADGGVIINQDNKKSKSEHAVYTAADGKVVLTGKPVVESPDGTITGKTITFWRGEQKMDVESDGTETNRTRLIIFPSASKKDSPDEAEKPGKPAPDVVPQPRLPK
jgi:lipopolysaccharide transport protein LptA